MIGVYCILNLMNGKRYVGSAAKCLKRRWRLHRAALRANRHRNKHLQAAWNKYGESSFKFVILCRCKRPEDCIAKEQEYLDKYNSFDRRFGYNISPTAGSQLGLEHSQETRRKLRLLTARQMLGMSEEQRSSWGKGMLGRTHTPEATEKIRISSTGRKHSKRTRAKMSRVQKALCSVRNRLPEHRAKLKAAWVRRKSRGWTMSEDARKKISLAHTGMKRSKEARENMSKWQRGIPKSQETKDKISATLTGRKHSEESKRKISEALRGYSRSEEFKAKIKASWIERRKVSK